MGMAAAAFWRCQELQSFGRADSASIHWAMESSFQQPTQTLTHLLTETWTQTDLIVNLNDGKTDSTNCTKKY